MVDAALISRCETVTLNGLLNSLVVDQIISKYIEKMTTEIKAKRVYRKRYGRRYRRRGVARNAITGVGAYRRGKAKHDDPYIPWGSMIGGAIGGLIGGPPGMAIGGGVGHLSQKLIKHFTGVGDYQVEVNTLLGPDFSPPELINKSKRGVCLRHREYIGEITAAANFTNTAYDINPGINTTFPWLAGVANNFEQYAFTGMIFEFKTLSADYTTAASAALGYVAMATQYNSLSPDFVDKIHMENYEFANSAKPSESFIHPIECKKSLTPTEPLYIRTGPVETNADQRLYDLGKFQIATGGNSGTGVLGELWCTYEVCLYKPKLVDQDDTIMSAHWLLGSVTGAGPLGTSQTADSSNNLDIIFTPTTITFPDTLNSARFLIVWNCVGASTASLVCPVISATSGCAIAVDWVNHANSTFQQENGITSVAMFVTWIVVITDYSAVVTVGGAGTIPASITSADLHIAQMYQ